VYVDKIKNVIASTTQPHLQQKHAQSVQITVLTFSLVMIIKHYKIVLMIVQHPAIPLLPPQQIKSHVPTFMKEI